MKKKSATFLELARLYVRRRLRKTFADVRISGRESLEALLAQGPAIIACNHVAWWDPFLLVQLDAALKSDGYGLMDASNLRQLPFFGWLGAIPLARSSNSAAYRDIVRARDLLSGPGRFVCIFPHGEQRPAHLPLDFQPGVAALAKGTTAPIVPLAIRYDYLESPRQVVHLAAGRPLDATCFESSEQLIFELENQVREANEQIDQEILAPTGSFQSLISRGSGAHAMRRIPAGASALKLLSRDGAP